MRTYGMSSRIRLRARAGVLALAVAAALGGTLPAQADKGIHVRGGIKGTVSMNPRCQGPDPAVVSFKVGRIERIDRHNARVELVAKIRNLGTEDLGDTRGKFGASMVYMPVAGRSQALASIELRDLPRGQGAVRVLRGWTRVYLGQEFPGTYTVVIAGDPDWQTRFDCNLRNSKRSIKERDLMERVAQVLAGTPQGRAEEAIRRDLRKRAQELFPPKVPQQVFGR